MQAPAPNAPGVEIPARLLALRADEEEFASSASRERPKDAAKEIPSGRLAVFEPAHDYFESLQLRPGALRVDFDSDGLSDLLIALAPDEHVRSLPRIVEHTPDDPRRQPRNPLAIDAQATGEAPATSTRLRRAAIALARACAGRARAHRLLPVPPAHAAAFPFSKHSWQT